MKIKLYALGTLLSVALLTGCAVKSADSSPTPGAISTGAPMDAGGTTTGAATEVPVEAPMTPASGMEATPGMSGTPGMVDPNAALSPAPMENGAMEAPDSAMTPAPTDDTSSGN